MVFDNWYRFQNYAKGNGFDSLKFSVMTDDGLTECRWLDAYMGLFVIDGEHGFVTVRDVDSINPNPVILVKETEK